jgi:hypothetical protein
LSSQPNGDGLPCITTIPYEEKPYNVCLAHATMGQPETKVEDLCVELGVTRQTLYRHAAPDGSLRADGRRLLARKKA